MENFIELLKTRRSVRKYKEKDIKQEDLNVILEAVKWSPSWTNSQCWEVVLIKDGKIKKELREIIAEKKNPASNSVIQAPVILGLCAKKNLSGFYDNKASTKFGDWFMFDLGIASQSICLTAASFGLGSVVIGLYDHDRVNKILNVPNGYENVALIPLGYPEKISKAPKRKEIENFVHHERFK